MFEETIILGKLYCKTTITMVQKPSQEYFFFLVDFPTNHISTPKVSKYSTPFSRSVIFYYYFTFHIMNKIKKIKVFKTANIMFLSITEPFVIILGWPILAVAGLGFFEPWTKLQRRYDCQNTDAQKEKKWK